MRLTVLAVGLLGLADASARTHYTRGSSGAHSARRKDLYEDVHVSSRGNPIRLPDSRDRDLPFAEDGEYESEPPMRVEFVSWDPR